MQWLALFAVLLGALAWVLADVMPTAPPIASSAIDPESPRRPVANQPETAPEPVAEADARGRAAPTESTTTSSHCVAGVVVDELGTPVQHHFIGFQSWSGDTPASLPACFPFQSATGQFELFLPDAPPWRLLVQAPGFVDHVPIRLEASGRIRIQLHRPALIHGRVLAPDGTPVPAIELECCDGNDGRTVVARANSADDGSYRLTPPTPGCYRVRAGGEQITNENQVVCATGSPAPLDLILKATVTILCTASTEGQPVANAQLTLQLPGGRRFTTTDASGSAIWCWVPRGRHSITATAMGLSTLQVAVETRDLDHTLFRKALPLQPLGR